MVGTEGVTENCSGWGTGIIMEPKGNETSAVGNLYQKIGEDTANWEDLRVCSSELEGVWYSDIVSNTATFVIPL
jgi:hypothetical protein